MSAHPVEGLPDESPAVAVVPMRRRHLRAVLRIEGRTRRSRPWSLSLFMGELALRQSRLYVVAKIGNLVIGYGGVMLNGDEAHVTNIAVDPVSQAMRVGTRMMVVLLRESVRRGMRSMTLEVSVANEPAQAMYRRFGFAPEGIRRNYYADIGEDALIMTARAIDADEYGDRLARIEQLLPSPTVVEGFAR
ncbi:MAG: hypothetical protein JJLCMIEE_01008 [Acidimicrobiales bacterium]|nr:MAG: ribosomal-protein-alanine N-acetyltransferase [Actinomycetota bacterium]MBV6507950.1 hypothetical protein [Acidimicrobiales bacterium]RIK06925.1 MAG: ribosomal-protein-alanine N-acetyltransferase [Acidobacteriota bacterium]